MLRTLLPEECHPIHLGLVPILSGQLNVVSELVEQLLIALNPDPSRNPIVVDADLNLAGEEGSVQLNELVWLRINSDMHFSPVTSDYCLLLG